MLAQPMQDPAKILSKMQRRFVPFFLWLTSDMLLGLLWYTVRTYVSEPLSSPLFPCNARFPYPGPLVSSTGIPIPTVYCT
jgi:hypothetical protein